jgi:hypothetical protein
MRMWGLITTYKKVGWAKNLGWFIPSVCSITSTHPSPGIQCASLSAQSAQGSCLSVRGYAAALAPSVAGLDSTGRGGCTGDNHCANGHTTLPLQLGQLARPVKITSQSRQHNARSSLNGPWNRMSSDTIGSSTVRPPLPRSGEACVVSTRRPASSHVFAAWYPYARAAEASRSRGSNGRRLLLRAQPGIGRFSWHPPCCE